MQHKLDETSTTTIIAALRTLQAKHDPYLATLTNAIPVLGDKDIDLLCDRIAFDGLLDPEYTKHAVTLLGKPSAPTVAQKVAPSPKYHGTFVPVPYGDEWMLQEALDGRVIRYGTMLKDQTGTFRRFSSEEAAAAFIKQMEINEAA